MGEADWELLDSEFLADSPGALSVSPVPPSLSSGPLSTSCKFQKRPFFKLESGSQGNNPRSARMAFSPVPGPRTIYLISQQRCSDPVVRHWAPISLGY